MFKYLIPVFLFSTSLLAQERGIVSGNSYRYYTTDDLQITRQELNYQNHRRNILWNYAGAQESNDDLGAKVVVFGGAFQGETISGTAGSLTLGRKWDFDSYTYLNLGGHRFEFDDDSSSIAIYELGHFFRWNKFSGKFFFNHDFMYPAQMIPEPLSDLLTRQVLQANIEYRKDNWRAPFSAKLISVSDGNSANELMLNVLYGGVYPVWWWVGYGVYQLQYDDNVAGYWSPEQFFSHGPRFEVTYPIVEKLSLTVGLNRDRIKERGFREGDSQYSSVGLEYGDRNEYLINLSWIEIVSEQGSNEWFSKGYYLSFEKSL